MANVASFVEPKFLNGEVLGRTPQVLTVKTASIDTLGDDQQEKVIVEFYEQEKPLVCNKTQLRLLISLFGDETEAMAQQRFDNAAARLSQSLVGHIRSHRTKYDGIAARLRPEQMRTRMEASHQRLQELKARSANAIQERLGSSGKMLEVLSYKNTLGRGYALVHGPDGSIVRSASAIESGLEAEIEFADGRAPATFGAGAPPPKATPQKATKKPKEPKKLKDMEDKQGRLL